VEPVFRFSLPIQVRFNDVDIMGHVSNTVYQNYYDAGKMDYFDELFDGLNYKDLGVVGASIRIDYLKPIFMKDEIYVETRISVLGTKSFTMEHRLVNIVNQELLSTCTAVIVCYDALRKVSIPMPAKWRENIINHEGKQLIIK
jgi:acyl-CoA thioester hydrolase